jgi:hypothetical protein
LRPPASRWTEGRSCAPCTRRTTYSAKQVASWFTLERKRIMHLVVPDSLCSQGTRSACTAKGRAHWCKRHHLGHISCWPVAAHALPGLQPAARSINNTIQQSRGRSNALEQCTCSTSIINIVAVTDPAHQIADCGPNNVARCHANWQGTVQALFTIPCTHWADGCQA